MNTFLPLSSILLLAGFAFAYQGRSWGYKTEIHHPVSKQYHYGGPSHGGYKFTKYDMPDYHHKPKYDHYSPPKYDYPKYDHHSSPKYHHKEVHIVKEPVYIKEKPAPKKEKEDSFGIKFEIPMGNIFDKLDEKEEPKEEEKKPDMYGYEKPAPPPKEEKKEFEIKIPKINIDKMFDKEKMFSKEMGGGEGGEGEGVEEDEDSEK